MFWTKSQPKEKSYTPPEWCTNEKDQSCLLRIRETSEFNWITDQDVIPFLRLTQSKPNKSIKVLRKHKKWLEKFSPDTISIDDVRVPMRTGCEDFSNRRIAWTNEKNFFEAQNLANAWARQNRRDHPPDAGQLVDSDG